METIGRLLLFVFMLGLAGFVSADNVSNCDFEISVPGEYIVSENLFAEDGDCIVISSSDVVLDCDGFVLDGNFVVDASGIRVSDVENVTVRNCEVFEFDAYGVILENVDDSVFENLVLDGNGVDFVNELFDKGGLSLIGSNENSFDNIVVMNDWWDNLYLFESSGNSFSNSLFDYAYNNGVTLLFSDNNDFDNVTISTPYFDGIDVLESDNNTLRNSFVSGADDGAEGGVGIFIDMSEGNLFYGNVFDNLVNADISFAGFENFWNTSTGNYWYGFSDSCDDVDDDGICDDAYNVSEGGMIEFDYMPLDNLEFWSFVRNIEIEFNASEWGANSTDFSVFSDEELASLSGVVFANEYGKILFGEGIGIFRDLVLSGNIVVSDGRILVNSSKLPEFNVSAELAFYGLSFDEPRILRDGVVCDDCVFSYLDGVLIFNVSGFSEYRVEEGYVEPVVEEEEDSSSGSSSSSGGGWGGCSIGYHIEYVGGAKCVADVVVSEEVIVLSPRDDSGELDGIDGDVIALDDEDEVIEFESVITGNVVGNGDAGSWKVALGMVVLVLVVVGLVRKKNVNGDVAEKRKK